MATPSKMKTLSVKELARGGASRAVRDAEAGPLLISKNDEPAVWMISAKDLAEAAGHIAGDATLYEGALKTLAAKLFDSGVLSMGRAAKLAGLTLTDFLDLCAVLRIPVFRAPPEGLTAEVDAFDRWLRSVEASPPHEGPRPTE